MVERIPPSKPAVGAARVDMLNFSKRFGALQALDDVSLSIEAGSMHALLGENGAGKSTLVKSLIGFYRADKGSVMVDGREHDIRSPRDAAQLGLGMIFQHFTLVPGMSVAENLALAQPRLSALIDWKAEQARLLSFMQTAPFPLPLQARVADLAAGEKQKLEILKALYARRRFLVLDEPTSVLTPQEADEVLGRVRQLCRDGLLTVLIITHKFREVFGFCDAVTVLRRGRRTGAAAVQQTSRDELAGWMMGVSGEAAAGPGAAPPDATLPLPVQADARPAPVLDTPSADTGPRLALRDLRVLGAAGLPAIDQLSLQVQAGEIVGIAGISGKGQRELLEALTGVLPLAGGEVWVDGQRYRPTRAQMQSLGVRSLPEEPLLSACVGRLSLAENLALRGFDRTPMARGPWLSRGAMRANALTQVAAYGIKAAGPDAPIQTLSGGNVQRAVLARELDEQPRLLIVANPCFGLDFQATAEIHARLRSARDGGAGVLLISEDLDELLALASQLLVLSHGQIALRTPVAQADIGVIGRAMAGDGTAHHDIAPRPAVPEAA